MTSPSDATASRQQGQQGQQSLENEQTTRRRRSSSNARRRANISLTSSPTAAASKEERDSRVKKGNGDENEHQHPKRPVFRTRLLSFDSVHEAFRIPLVKSRYRHNFTIKESFLSILDPSHNQAFNIYTHALGWLFFLWMTIVEWGALRDREAPLFEKVVTMGYLLCAQTQMLTSALYHTLANVSPSLTTTMLKVDVLGIILMIFGSNAIGYYHGFRCEPSTAAFFMLGLFCCLATSAIVSWLPFKNIALQDSLRNASFVLSVGFGVWPSLSWWNNSAAVLPEDMRWLIVKSFLGMALGYAGGFCIYILRIPERWAPDGRFDVIGSSHQFWHVMVFAAGVSWCIGMLTFGAWAKDNLTCNADGLALAGEALAASLVQAAGGAANLTASSAAP